MMQTGYAPQTPLRLLHDQERAALRRRALFAGWVVLIFFGTEIPLATVDSFFTLFLTNGHDASLSEWIGTFSPLGSALYDAVQYAILLAVPILVGFAFCRKCGARPVVTHKIPAAHAIALLAVGLAACVSANFFSGLITEWLSFLGFDPISIPSTQDGSPAILLVTLVSTAVLPAILEELLFRGVVLQLLRPAGDRTALILSALLFGMAHGTVEQIPFAFVVGLACGYYVLKTGNLFLGMVLHFLNNAMAVLLDYAMLDATDAESVAWTYSAFILLTALGVIGWLFLRRRAPQVITPVYDGRSSWLSRGERRRVAWLTPTVLIYLIIALLFALIAARPAWLTDLFSFGGVTYG